jgi:glycine/D-amino acid oxidase-like deaminating enzyme
LRTTVAVVGSGPIGAATAYGLVRAGVPDVTVVGGGHGPAAYRSSGGAVCWHRDDPGKAAMIKATADFVRQRVAAGARIRYREQPYLFLDAGVLAPALNITAADLVADLTGLARRHGVRDADLGRVTGVEPVEGGHRVTGERGTLEAGVVVLALGTGNAALTGDHQPVEKRQLFVLDLPVDADRAALPHLVAAVGSGYAYVFVKQTAAGLRLLLGQEELIADHDLSGPVDHLAELLDAGVADRFPFLRGARAEQVLWGVDRVGKLPAITAHRPGLISVNCGSAVRACVPIGERAAAAVAAALA